MNTPIELLTSSRSDTRGSLLESSADETIKSKISDEKSRCQIGIKQKLSPKVKDLQTRYYQSDEMREEDTFTSLTQSRGFSRNTTYSVKKGSPNLRSESSQAQNKKSVFDQNYQFQQQKINFEELKDSCIIVNSPLKPNSKYSINFQNPSKEKDNIKNVLQLEKLKKIRKFYFQIRVSQITRKFIQIMKSTINQYINNEQQLMLIDDKSYIPKQEHKIGLLEHYWKDLLSQLNTLPVVLPENPIFIAWELLVLFMIILQLLFIPMKIAYTLKDLQKGLTDFFLFGNFALIVFSVDIFLVFNTACYVKGILTKSRIEIATHYLKTDFLVDVISTISIILVIIYRQNIYDAPFVIRALQIKTRLIKMDQFFQLKEKYPITVQICTLIVFILVMAHIFGCGFYQAGKYDAYYGKDSWIVVFEYQDKDLLSRYVTSLYFTFISMITVGYGDIHPVTNNEKLYTIFMTIFSCGIFGYCINNIVSIFQSIKQKQDESENKRSILKSYLVQRQINFKLITKAIQNLEYQEVDKFQNDKEAEQLLKKLDPQIFGEFQQEYYGSILNIFGNIFQKFSKNTQREITKIMSEGIYQAGEILFREGQIVSDLFVLINGKGEFFEPTSDLSLSILKQQNSPIAINEFISSGTFSWSFRFIKQSQVIKINRNQLMLILGKNQKDYQKFCDVRDSIALKLFYQKSGETCQQCNVSTHSLMLCDNLHAKFNNKIIINRNMQNESSERQKFERKNKICNFVFQQKRECLKSLRNYIAYILYGVEEFTDHDTDDHFFFTHVPVIKNNFLNMNKYLTLQELTNQLTFLNEQNENNLNQYQINKVTEEMNELHSFDSEYCKYQSNITVTEEESDDSEHFVQNKNLVKLAKHSTIEKKIIKPVQQGYSRNSLLITNIGQQQSQKIPNLRNSFQQQQQNSNNGKRVSYAGSQINIIGQLLGQQEQLAITQNKANYDYIFYNFDRIKNFDNYKTCNNFTFIIQHWKEKEGNQIKPIEKKKKRIIMNNRKSKAFGILNSLKFNT